MKRTDLAVQYATFAYLSIPILIFFVGWLQTGYAFVCCLLLIYGVVTFCKNLPKQTDFDFVPGKQFAVVAGLAFVWVSLSGIGGFANQDWDHHFRNALFRDLIQQQWPVYYSFPADYKITELANHQAALNYYFTFWLPAALAGRMAGPVVANVFLLLWSYAGILLILYQLNRLFNFKYTLFVSLLFIMWSGLDILGKVFIDGQLPPSLDSIELYFHYTYTAFTTDLFNVFNQAIPTWLVTCWILNFRKDLTIVPIILLIPYAPFPCVGLSVFYGLYFIGDKLSLTLAFE